MFKFFFREKREREKCEHVEENSFGRKVCQFCVEKRKKFERVLKS